MTGLAVGSLVAERYEVAQHLATQPDREQYRVIDREVQVEMELWLLSPVLFPSAEARQSFVQRALEMRKVKGEHLLRLFNAGIVGEQVFVTYQLSTALDLSKRWQAGVSLARTELARLARAASAGLDAAHEQGRYHGHLMPWDLVEVSGAGRGEIKVAGVGLWESCDRSAFLRLHGAMTPWLAPELARGGVPDARSDWFALAVMLLFSASASEASTLELALEHMRREDPDLHRALATALQGDAAHRPQKGESFVSPILACLHAGPANVESEAPAVIDAANDVGARSFLDDDDEATEFHAPVPAGPPEGARTSVATPAPDEDETVLDVRPPTMGELEAAQAAQQNRAWTPAAGVGETSDELKLEMRSMKPATPAAGRPKMPTPIIDKSGMKPVIRPLASLRDGADVDTQDRGYLAPPRESKGSARVVVWGLILLALAAVAFVVATEMRGVGTTTSSTDAAPTTEAAKVVAAAEGASDAASLEPEGGGVEARSVEQERGASIATPRCPEGTVPIGASSVCIDVYEYPGTGEEPERVGTIAGARERCEQRGGRLCTGDEWESACRGPKGRSYPYGDRYRSEICNTEAASSLRSGQMEDCSADNGAKDMSGNIAEWVEDGSIRGGSYRDRKKARCSARRSKPKGKRDYSDLGLRCCHEALASQ